MQEPNPNDYIDLIKLAQSEDLGPGDLTSQATIPADLHGFGEILFKEQGVLCGLPIVRQVLHHYDDTLELNEMAQDGQNIAPGTIVATAAGPMRAMLAAERILLNFLQRLSGVATTTASYVAAVAGSNARIYDTRKTTPGWRTLEKYAVRCGGGCNHRLGLYDAVLVKDNHLAAMGGDDWQSKLTEAVAGITQADKKPDFIEVEVDSLEQLQIVLQIKGVNRILLDNMTCDQLAQAVQLRDQCGKADIKLEASGGITLQTVPAVAQSGVDIISVGALTHTVNSLDIGFNVR